MKTLLIFFFCIIFTISSFSKPNDEIQQLPYTVIKAQSNSNSNNVSTWIWNTGVFNQDLRTNNTPGFEWPKNSGKFAIFSTGLSMGAYVNGGLRLASVSYNGEYGPGYVLNGVFTTNSTFKLYRVNRGDNNNTNPDYANWGLMVPFGAPYEDVNNNGVFDPATDKPGVKNSAQTIFVCLTDADATNHTTAEGFSGGTAPLFSEMHFTTWSYDNVAGLEDVQFLKMEVVNKNSSPWTRTQFGIVADPDLGSASDDYVGCDLARNLGFCYNADNLDGDGTGHSYGANPPAVGIDMLKGAVNRSVTPNTDLYMTSFISFFGTGSGGIICETDPSTAPIASYNYLKGTKRDSTPYINPLTMLRTKYCYPGDLESGNEWTEFVGKINNCGGDTTGPIVTSVPFDRRFVMSSGAENLTIVPGEKQTFVFAQLIARGANNRNSVTKLKQLSDMVQLYYNANFSVSVNTVSNQVPDKFSLFQNYPNPFNPSTKIKFEIAKSDFVNLTVFDLSGKVVEQLVNEKLNEGVYEVNYTAKNISSGIYFYRLSSDNFTQTNRMILLK
ncbi:MAG: T9SS type A sorting domain-containing protein [Bacteroidetes bacterium]|nr:T9SS type A sorting domain-containing protein [Bacteroidota bacterium]